MILDIGVSVLVSAFFTTLLIYCLRMRVVGPGAHAPWLHDAHRTEQPIRYWIGIAGLVFGTAFSWLVLLYVVLLQLR